jgi:hypothetical protein
VTRKPTTGRPWLAVIVPTFNGEAYISTALESVAAQADDDVECIVVDDGSTDRTIEIARSFRDRLQLTVLDPVPRGNWVAATNDGLRQATAEFACFLHQDDLWLPTRLAAARQLVETEPHAALWTHAAEFVSPLGRWAGWWHLPLSMDRGVEEPSAFIRKLLVQNFVCVAAPVFRREVALASGGLDEALWYTADWDLWLRLAAQGPVAYENKASVAFRLHPESQTALRTASTAGMRDQLERVFLAHFRTWSVDVDRKSAALVERVGRASIEINVALAAASHGDKNQLRGAFRSLCGLGPRAALVLLRESRLIERVGARVRLRLRGRNP